MEAGQEMLLAEVLSPSQVSQFLNCPAKWMFRYLLDLKESGTAATALGRAFHETIAHNFRQKAETADDLSVAECLDCFRKALGPQLEEAKLQKGEHPMELLELGETMVTKYIEDAAPLVRPLAIEGRIIDAKSALKPLKGIAHDHHLQLTSYVMITPAASGACRLDTVTKGKTVSLIQKSFFINEKDRHYAETIYPMVQDSIREGIFLPRSSSPLCSRRFCGFWNVCEKEYGGSVRCD